MDPSPPNLSFIGIVDFSQEARWIYMTESVTDLLGFEPKELIGRPSLELVHPDEFPRVKQLHHDTIQQDKAAVLVYLRMRHKDPYKGFILCGISRTVVHNVLVGSVSFASPAKALHNASTAQEITVISPSAMNFEFRRWNDPSPMPPSPGSRTVALPGLPSSPASSSDSADSALATRCSWTNNTPSPLSSPHNSPLSSPTPPSHHYRSRSPPRPESPPTFDPLPSQSFRTALILDRFSIANTILYCSNDLLIGTTACIGRPFADFVAPKDENIVRSWIECVKGWGVNERGQPSDGGFGFGRFTLLVEGRDSIKRAPDPPTPSRHKHGSGTKRRGAGRAGNGHSSGYNHNYSNGNGSQSNYRRGLYPLLNGTSHSNGIGSEEVIIVDAIFSAHSDGLMVILRRAS